MSPDTNLPGEGIKKEGTGPTRGCILLTSCHLKAQEQMEFMGRFPVTVWGFHSTELFPQEDALDRLIYA